MSVVVPLARRGARALEDAVALPTSARRALAVILGSVDSSAVIECSALITHIFERFQCCYEMRTLMYHSPMYHSFEDMMMAALFSAWFQVYA